MGMLLQEDFYLSAKILDTAKILLGKVICTEINGEICSGIIVETEAYKAPEDKGSHAYDNKFTNRTKTIFKKGGISYVYLCYGIHRMFNVVSAPEGIAHAILVRALEPLEGIDRMKERRKNSKLTLLCNGPGKLCQAMGIELLHDGTNLLSRDSGLWIEDRGITVDPSEIIAGPRVGIAYAEECANWPWRFRILDNQYTSKPDLVSYG